MEHDNLEGHYTGLKLYKNCKAYNMAINQLKRLFQHENEQSPKYSVNERGSKNIHILPLHMQDGYMYYAGMN